MKKGLLILTICMAAMLFYIYFPVMQVSEPFDEPLLTFRFDDAFANQKPAIMLLEEKKLTGSFYPIDASMGTPGYMTAADLTALEAKGHEIGYHSSTHQNLLLTLSQGHRHEILPGTFASEKGLKSPRTFAFPYGAYNPLFLNQVREVYQGACVYPILRAGTLNGKNRNPWFVDCIEISDHTQFSKLLTKAIGGRLWLIACFHRIEEAPGPWSLSLEEFKKIARDASSEVRKGRIRLVTVSEGVEKLGK